MKTIHGNLIDTHELRLSLQALSEILDDRRFKAMASVGQDCVETELKNGGAISSISAGKVWLVIEEPSPELIYWLKLTVGGKRLKMPSETSGSNAANNRPPETKLRTKFKSRGYDRNNQLFEFGVRYTKELRIGTLAARIHENIYAVLEGQRNGRLAEGDRAILQEEFMIASVAELSKYMSRLIGLLVRKCPDLKVPELAKLARDRDELHTWYARTLNNRAGFQPNQGGLPEGVFEALALAMNRLGYSARYRRRTEA